MSIKKRIIIIYTMILAMIILLVPLIDGKKVNAEDYMSAQVLPFDGTWSVERNIEALESQYYKIVIPADGRVSLSIMSYISDEYFSLSVYDEEFINVLFSERPEGGSSTQPSTTKYNIVLSTGTYYLRVFAGDGGGWFSANGGIYKLRADFLMYNVNDDRAVSYDSPQIYILGEEIICAMTLTDKADWFKITVPKTAYYIQKITSYVSDDLHWYLYNEDLSSELKHGWAEETDETTPKPITDEIALSEGIYYVKVTSSGTGRYSYNFSQITQETCEHEYENSYVYPTYFSKGYVAYICTKCGYTYNVEYPKSKLAQGSFSSYSTYGSKGKIYAVWNTVNDASGYQICYSTSKGMKKNAATVKIKNASKTKKTIKNLKRKKTYYLQVRAYVKSGSKTAYGKWSDTFVVKTQ